MVYGASAQMSDAFSSGCFCDKCCQPYPKPDARPVMSRMDQASNPPTIMVCNFRRVA
jgi:hypothetical protein